MYKIIFTDIDGTLLGPDRDLTENTISQFKKINHIPLVLVSARMPKQMHHLQEKLNIVNEPLIAFNGALVTAGEKTIHSTEIPINIIEALVEFNENTSEEKIHIGLFNHNNWYVEEMDYWAKREENNTKITPEIKKNKDVVSLWKETGKGAHKIMCMGDAAYIDGIFKFLEDNFNDSLHLYRSKDTYIEIANKEVSKLTGIKLLLEDFYPSISLEEVIAFGDNYNDVEMIGAVGHGVAVSNARDEVKAVAKAVTSHHKEDGVAVYLESLFK
ncbi:HAD family hydrolase [Galbibacter mesophilus]|uniref:HAD family hydrolase n=1 Tax=Galbibacter mesophilus TaxID=379069 RepID=UPI00191FDE70|nr:HAD family hydrolase [Galbibacter mesophilus]MCM5661553.1 Cof-type HAD-IIB family hydrolase [Galbibacter mesophilus]